MNLLDQLNVELYILLNLITYQFGLIFPYWAAGVIAGSFLSVFAADRIYNLAARLQTARFSWMAVLTASILGTASPVCMYGTVPLIAALGRRGVPQYTLAAFMVSSILLNPNLFVFTFVLGVPMAIIRLAACLSAGVAAGLLVRFFFRKRELFVFSGFDEKAKCSVKGKSVKEFLGSIHRGILKTAPYLLVGVMMTALFDRYFPKQWLSVLFLNDRKLGVLFAASLGVPVYVCGGGTMPLLKSWLSAGMSPGSALAFMITGPATKLTNLSAVKIILGLRNFTLYIAFNIVFAVITGLLIDLIYKLFQ